MSRYQYTAARPVPQRASLNQSVDITTEDIKKLPAKREETHWLFYAGLGMTLFLIGYIVATSLVIPFFTGIGNHWQYGQAGLSQYDFNVGHGGISHFIAQDDNGTLIIIEIVEAGVYPSHVYTGKDLAVHTGNRVVTLSLVDVNHDGLPDLEVSIAGDSLPLVLYNNGKTFQDTPPESK
jgi:hypothetical protein